jgi:hypothetical protein
MAWQTTNSFQKTTQRMTETQWDRLLRQIVRHQVIPVVGDGVIQAPAAMGGGLLSRWIATELQRKLGMPEQTEATLNQVVVRYLLSGGTHKKLYATVFDLLEDHAGTLTPQQPLLDLAAIGDFSLYLSTTFDSLLLHALNEVRHGGDPKTIVSVYHPKAHGLEKDMPFQRSQLPPGGAMLAHLLGRASTKPDYALWDEDLLEFILGLHRDLAGAQMENLAYDLQDGDLLFIGLRFSDWLTRFLVRVTEQKKLSETKETSRFLAMTSELVEPNMVIFFDSLRQETEVWECDPAEFARELKQRWERLRGAAFKPVPAQGAYSGNLPGRVMPSNSIFLSYAREDFDAVKQLKAELEIHGCKDVWFDLERLQAGEHWRNALENEVRRRCAVFVSCISRTTVAKVGELHRERGWAKDTAPIFGDGATFYVAVILDDLKSGEVRREPVDLFKEGHAISLRNYSIETLAKRLQELQAQNHRA